MGTAFSATDCQVTHILDGSADVIILWSTYSTECKLENRLETAAVEADVIGSC